MLENGYQTHFPQIKTKGTHSNLRLEDKLGYTKKYTEKTFEFTFRVLCKEIAKIARSMRNWEMGQQTIVAIQRYSILNNLGLHQTAIYIAGVTRSDEFMKLKLFELCNLLTILCFTRKRFGAN